MFAPLGVFEIAGVGGDGLCPAHARKHHAQRAQQVKVGKGIHGEPPLPLCGVVAQQPCCQRVAALVEGDGHQRHQRADEIIDALRGHSIFLPFFSISYIILFFEVLDKGVNSFHR